MTAAATRAPSAGLALAAGILANILLGLSSLFWKALAAIAPLSLLGLRILISLATLAILMGALGRLRGLKRRLARRDVCIHAAAALLVAVNWGAFIRASIEGHVLESGLGYLLAPFVAIGAGSLALGETMSRMRLAALALILLCVLALFQRSQELQHWVYLTIGLSWGCYACMKKATGMDPFDGLLCETVVLSVVCVAALALPGVELRVPAQLPAETRALLAASGLVSVLPLWLFSRAAAGLPLIAMGFLQFVLPITQLAVALLVYRQPLSWNSAVCFGGISLALLSILSEPLLARRDARIAE